MGTITTSGIESAYGATAFPSTTAIPDALVHSQSRVSAVIEGDSPALQVPYIATQSTAQIVAEGDAIPEGGAAASEMIVYTRKVASIETITNEAKSSEQMTQMLTASLNPAIMDKANAVFLQNPKPSGETSPTGLFNLDNVNTGTLTGSLDAIVEGIAAVSSKGGTPTSIIMNHGTWAKLLLLKYTDGRPMIAPSVADSPTPMLYGLPVVLTKAAPESKLLINDANEVISAVGSVNLNGSEDAEFSKDKYMLRGTFRLGWGVIHPDRLAVITVNTTPTE